MENYVITIARGFGSGGKEIGTKLAKKLGIHCYENRILVLASQLSGLDQKMFEEVDEKIRGDFIRGFLKGIPRQNLPKSVKKKFVSDDRLFDFQKQIIQNLADTESCVIVGKCADWVLKDRQNVMSVYIEAPRAFCLERIKTKMNVSDEVANRSITETDQYRADYYQYYTGGNYWTNPVNYDITINSERMGVENSVELVLDAMEVKFGKEQMKSVFPKVKRS